MSSMLIEKFRKDCLARGASGIKGIARFWSNIDDDNNRVLSLAEFSNGIKGHALKYSDNDISELFQEFDKNGTGSIDYKEFLEKLRPPMSQSRISLIRKAFEKMDKTKDGKITVDDLRGVYSVKKHPKYLSGQLTEDQLLKQFLDNFDTESHADGVVTYEEFVNYYAGVSASIDSDVYFDLMMRQGWKL